MDKQLFVQSVKNYCERKNVKPTVACREAGVGTSFINNIEARGQVPSVEKVQQLAQYLGVTTSELLGEVPCAPPDVLTLHDSAVRGERCETLRLSVDEVKIALAYRNADQRARDIVDLTLEPFFKEGSGTDG